MLKNNLNKSHRMHQNWLKALGIIEQLHDLCFDIRSHRGTSTAQLEGDIFFQNITQNTSQRISQALVQLGDQHAIFKALNSHKEFLEITRLWLNIQASWQATKSYDNFVEHCQLIEKIQQLIWQLASFASPDILDNNEKARLAHFILRTQAELMENIAQLRGLSCLYCARGELQRKDKKIIRDEIQGIYQIWQGWLCELNELPAQFRQPLNDDVHQNQLKRYIDEFIQLVQGFQSQQLPNASETFNAANRILNALNSQYKSGLELLRSCLRDELQQWISNPPKVLLTDSYQEIAPQPRQRLNA